MSYIWSCWLNYGFLKCSGLLAYFLYSYQLGTKDSVLCSSWIEELSHKSWSLSKRSFKYWPKYLDFKFSLWLSFLSADQSNRSKDNILGNFICTTTIEKSDKDCRCCLFQQITLSWNVIAWHFTILLSVSNHANDIHRKPNGERWTNMKIQSELKRNASEKLC